MDNYRQVTAKAGRREPFQGNTMQGYWDTDGYYWVYSYDTPIALYDPSDDTVYVNEHTYSVTTSRHLGALYLLRTYATYEVSVMPDNYLSSSAYDALRQAVDNFSPVN